MEEKAKELGYIFLFITLTCPPEFHSNTIRKKSKWANKSAKEANEFLQEQWRKLGRTLDKFDLYFNIERGRAFGKKVVEPHKDGCPASAADITVKHLR
ncbi:replication endonuclease [Vibrio anguillarum]|uniref:replication endonuclease n=1 Tax=Vibrio anguillarum TaxID=55601 RepID=UPI000427D95C|nr:replication endonuclease [Vibrio anguillarum]